MIVSVTRLRLRSLWFLLPFLWYANRSLNQAKASPGNVKARTRRIGLSFWTLTAWVDEAAVRDYMLSGAHGKALPKLKFWCDEAATARWSEAEPSMDWESAERKLAELGRLQKVHHPSPAHAAGRQLGSAGLR